jgi:hypothetical protein
MWEVKTEIVPIVNGTLETIKEGLEQNIQLLPGHLSAIDLQKFKLMSNAQSMVQVLG